MTRVERLLAETLSVGEENMRLLDAELRQARAGVRSAVEQYRSARRTLNERFDGLARCVEEARARALSELDASYAAQEQRITFDVEASKAQRRSAHAALSQARGFAEKPRESPRGVTIAPPDDAAGDAAGRIAHVRVALEVPVRHIRGVRVFAGSEAAFDAAASAIRAVAADARAEPEEPEPSADSDALTGHVRRPSEGLALQPAPPDDPQPAPRPYRRSDRRFLVLSAASEKRALDVCGKVRGAIGRCVVDNLCANETLASFEDIGGYDAVLVWVGGCTSFAGGPVLGSVLARYVAAGGGVVVCPWALATDDDGDGLRGEVVDSGLLGTYLGECISGSRLEWRRQQPTDEDASSDPQQQQQQQQQWELGEVEAGVHPLLWGVRHIDGGVYSGHHALRVADNDSVGTVARVECAAMWEDGTPLAIVSASAKEGGRFTTAVVNLYPVSSDFSVRCWDTTTDVAVLMANALHLVARRT